MRWPVKASILAIVLGLIICTQLEGQSDQSVIKSDTIGKERKVQFIILPIIFYTPETKFGFGAGAQVFFKKLTDVVYARESNILFTGIYTTEKQLILEVTPKIYLSSGKRYIDAQFRYKVFPNSFWGIGNSTPESNLERYNMRTIHLRVDLLERTFDNSIRFGTEFYFEKNVMLETQEEGLLESGLIAGSEGATISGLGLIFNLDSRDNVFSTKSGWYFQFKGRFSSLLFGATYSYNKFEIDLRKYIVLNGKHVIAGQIYTNFNLGEVPFQDMAWFGGGERGRGYFRGRYIDKHMYSLQLEYRYHISPRWIAAAFVSGGEVGNKSQDLFTDFHPSIGGGIRWKIRKDNPTFIRLDFGKGTGENSGVYFGVNEAF